MCGICGVVTPRASSRRVDAELVERMTDTLVHRGPDGAGIFVARDRFGVKPLYYAHTADGSFYFASEIKAILASGAVRPALDETVLPDNLANHAPSGADTMF